MLRTLPPRFARCRFGLRAAAGASPCAVRLSAVPSPFTPRCFARGVWLPLYSGCLSKQVINGTKKPTNRTMQPEKLTKKTDKSNIGLSGFISIFATDEDNRQHWGVTCERNPRLKHKAEHPHGCSAFSFSDGACVRLFILPVS